MNELIYLHIPTYQELWYREKIMRDPDTMSYNKDYDLNSEGYDKVTGCIDFPKRRWKDWYAYFIGQEPLRFYAYIVRKSDDAFIGEVNVHKNQGLSWYDMGIVIEARYRGSGYAKEAMGLLLQHAFEEMNVDAVHNSFEAERKSAVQLHLSAGFLEYENKNGILELLITREQYYKIKENAK